MKLNYKKVILSITATIIMTTTIISTEQSNVYANNYINMQTPISIVLDGNYIDCSQQAPVNINGRVLVPLRAIFESLGATVQWDNDLQKVTAITNNMLMEMYIGNNLYSVNNQLLLSDVAPQIINNTTMVPVRVVSESLGCSVEWNNDTQTVNITSNYAPTIVQNQNQNITQSYVQEPSGIPTLIGAEPTTVEAKNAMALEIAQQIANYSKTDDNIQTVINAVSKVNDYFINGVYASSGANYSTAYGVFIAGESSCAGVTRALGMVLDCLGYEWTHINENQWEHQWCEVIINGNKYFADAQSGIFGLGNHPVNEPENLLSPTIWFKMYY